MATTNTDDTRPLVCSYGLGADSTAILLRWILEPESRDFDLSRLIVITSMTGDEFKDTGALVKGDAHSNALATEALSHFHTIDRP